MKIIKGLSLKSDGSMKIAQGPSQEVNKLNREKFLAQLGLDHKNMVLAGLVHGTKIVAVTGGDKGKTISECDGLVTDNPGVILGLTGADCLPVFLWDEQNKVISLVHAGWRGIKGKIISEVVGVMVKDYGCSVKNILVEFGPYIKSCHFEIKEDVSRYFLDYADCLIRNEIGEYLDLGAVVKSQLVALGVEKVNIKTSAECTFCDKEKYFSYRRDKPEEIQAMLACIVIV